MFVFNLAFQISNEQIRIAKCFFPYSVSRAEESYLFTKLPLVLPQMATIFVINS